MNRHENLPAFLEKTELHNVGEAEFNEGYGGWILNRFPSPLRNVLSTIGRLSSTEASGIEIRFVTDASILRICCSITDIQNTVYANALLYIYKGDYLCSSHRLTKGVRNTIEVRSPDSFKKVPVEKLHNGYFSPDVWRFVFTECQPVIHDINVFGGQVRPPEREEKPALRYLAYGSSITHHGSVDGYSYTHHAARLLKVDIINKGLGGGCMCEPELADWLADQSDWDFATLELGINMVNEYTSEQFKDRAAYLIKQIVQKHAEKKIFVIDVYPNSNDFPLESNEYQGRQSDYRSALRSIVEECAAPNLHYIDAASILPDFYGLSADLLHPCGYGHIRMGDNLAKIIGTYLKD